MQEENLKKRYWLWLSFVWYRQLPWLNPSVWITWGFCHHIYNNLVLIVAIIKWKNTLWKVIDITLLNIHNSRRKCLFRSVVAVAFQSVFRAEIHQNDVFLFLKNYFWDQHKTIQNAQKKLIFNKKKWFFKERGLYRVSKQCLMWQVGFGPLLAELDQSLFLILVGQH